jgi:hypothetical protein
LAGAAFFAAGLTLALTRFVVLVAACTVLVPPEEAPGEALSETSAALSLETTGDLSPQALADGRPDAKCNSADLVRSGWQSRWEAGRLLVGSGSSPVRAQSRRHIVLRRW